MSTHLISQVSFINRFYCRKSDLTSVPYRQDVQLSHIITNNCCSMFSFCTLQVSEMCKGSLKTPIQLGLLKWGSGYAMYV